MDPLGSLVWRYVTPERKRWQREALDYVRSQNPRLPTPYLPIKAAEVLRVLDRYKPRSIVEFGSGHSTAWFAAYAAETGAKVTSFEHNPQWIERTKALIADLGPVDQRLAPTKNVSLNGHPAMLYDVDIPPAELIYVDGPSAAKHICDMDAARLALDPIARVVMVDGRTATVEALLTTMDPGEWKFSPSVNFAFHRRWWRESLKRRAHSYFVRNVV